MKNQKSIQLTKPATYVIYLSDYKNVEHPNSPNTMWIENKDATGYNVTNIETDAWVFTKDNLLTDGYGAMRYLLTKYHIGNDDVQANVSMKITVGTREDWHVYSQFLEKIKLVLNSIDLQFNNQEIIGK